MEFFPGTQGKKKVHHLWKERQATQEVFKEFVRSWRKKSSEVKAQLGLNQATSMKNNEKYFYK